jgi:hypothetical protein
MEGIRHSALSNVRLVKNKDLTPNNIWKIPIGYLAQGMIFRPGFYQVFWQGKALDPLGS